MTIAGNLPVLVTLNLDYGQAGHHHDELRLSYESAKRLQDFIDLLYSHDRLLERERQARFPEQGKL